MFELTLKNKSYLLIISSFLLIGCGEASSTAPTQLSSQENLTKISITKQEFLDAVNKARSTARDCYPDDPDRGFMEATHPLTWNNELYASALEHASDLAESDTFSHLGSGTVSDITGDGKASDESSGGKGECEAVGIQPVEGGGRRPERRGRRAAY